MSQDLGEILVATRERSREADLQRARARQRNGGVALEEALAALGLADEPTIYRALAKAEGMPFVDLSKGKVADDVVARVPAEFATEQGIMPVMEKGGRLIVAIDDPIKRIVADQLQFLLGETEVSCAMAAPSALKRAIEAAYGAGGRTRWRSPWASARTATTRTATRRSSGW